MKKRHLIFSIFLLIILFVSNQNSYGTNFNGEKDYETISSMLEENIIADSDNHEKIILSSITNNEIKSEESVKISDIFSKLFCKVGGVNILKSKYKVENITKSDNYESIIFLIILIYICTEICEYLITTNASGLGYFNTQQFKRLEKNTLYKDAIVDDKDIPPSQIENETLYYKANNCYYIIMT